MTETEFVAQEQAKLDATLKANLERFRDYGFHRSRIVTDTLCIAGYIIWSSPCDGILYNHYKLTDEGKRKLHELSCPKGWAYVG